MMDERCNFVLRTAMNFSILRWWLMVVDDRCHIDVHKTGIKPDKLEWFLFSGPGSRRPRLISFLHGWLRSLDCVIECFMISLLDIKGHDTSVEERIVLFVGTQFRWEARSAIPVRCLVYRVGGPEMFHLRPMVIAYHIASLKRRNASFRTDGSFI